MYSVDQIEGHAYIRQVMYDSTKSQVPDSVLDWSDFLFSILVFETVSHIPQASLGLAVAKDDLELLQSATQVLGLQKHAVMLTSDFALATGS